MRFYAKFMENSRKKNNDKSKKNIMNKKHILIGTTSINRPNLHNDNINDWYKWINSVDKSIYDVAKISQCFY